MIYPFDLFPHRDALAELLERFSTRTIAVVGDFFLDRYLVIDPELEEPSIETGLPAHQIVAIRNSPGAAGTVVNNLVALGAGKLHAIGIIGDDAHGYELVRELSRRKVDTTFLLKSPERFTPTYTKPMVRRASGEEELSRLDVLNRTPTPAALLQSVMTSLDALASEIDALVVLDQVIQADCGVVTARLRDHLVSLAKSHPNLPIIADSRAFLGTFREVMVKANASEVISAAGLAESTEIEQASAKLCETTHRPVFVTRGDSGVLVRESLDSPIVAVPGVKIEGPVDVTGAGDSVTAGLILARSAGASLAQSAAVGNLVASLTVQQLGTTGTASREQVLERFDLWVKQF